MKQNNVDPEYIIFFDGICNLCNGFIDFVIKRDKAKKIFYSSLQSDISNKYINCANTQTNSSYTTIYLYKNGKVHDKSTAILMILKELSFGYRTLAGFFLLLPKVLRDSIYNFIARNRYRFFGKRDSCRLPNPEEKDQFL
ncbi:thiol-disulfide oxidoreductase DCC family protein [Muriicola soli]|uniref:DUF393 domain-containing protein n=1 Tax=Muriicola soli TaxID=2507538 RepID=A0A411E8I0_9FLAO|nr:DUF393 domain-containing protein [Muriicola soli]